MAVAIKSFRSLRKEGLEIQVPPIIAEEIRLKAASERRSISEVGSELLAIGLGYKAKDFGIGKPSPAA